MTDNKTNKKTSSEKHSKSKKSSKTYSKKKITKQSDKASDIEIKPVDKINPNNIVRPFTWKQGVLIALVFIITLIVGTAYKIFISTTNSIINSDNNTPIVEQLNLILGSDDKPLQGEEEDRINVLLLGIGGTGHDGGTLTDSIMVASLKPSTNQVALLSLPRDLVVKVYDDENPNLWEGRKINFAYELGGVDLAIDKVTEVTGLELHYYVVVDFAGFKKIIDDVNGLDVTVDKSFTGLYGAKELSVPCPSSQTYHLEDGAYCAIPFNRGVESMDGERSLIFSRIRKLAPGSLNQDEGTDFARAQRQQKILESFKDKLFSTETLLNPSRITDILTDLGDHLETNIELWEMAKLIQITSEINTDDIISRVVDESPNGLVYSKIYEPTGASVVIPQAGEYNFSEIHTLADNIFEHTETIEESATVQVLNGTVRNGLAAQTADMLRTYEVEVIDIGNAPDQTQTITRIYDTTNGEKKVSLELLLEKVGGTQATQKQLTDLIALDKDEEYIDATADFIIILGEDAINTITSYDTTKDS